MGLPTSEDNYRGYRAADLTEQAEWFRNTSFYLIHASADKNVHLQQSMVFARRLVEEGVLFRQQVRRDFELYSFSPRFPLGSCQCMYNEKPVLFGEMRQIYPDDGHGLWWSLPHLFEGLEAYFAECMGPLPDWFSPKCVDEGICYV